ncbi:hypothetical protein F5Y02DRAFT_370981 [Annulohypoxylon stygium]|nr:hypothetical protein F5Y02DRAFT_370981 [Annulohypoxylon stygium]
MPPKRAASGPAVVARKRTKPSTNRPTRSTRWSAISASANADADYKTTWQNPDRWYSYVTICPPIQDDDDDDDDDEDDEDDDEGKKKDEDNKAEGETRDGPGCGKKHCLCLKPALQNPDHPWLVSMAGYRKFRTQLMHLDLRDPDTFQMYTFNDHASYGCIEIMENLFLDYEEAAERGWREQWATCEGLALWLLSPASDIMMMCDDGDRVEAVIGLAGCMFLDMLARLDDQDLVGDATDVKSLGTFMAVFLKVAPEVREIGIIDSERGDKKTFEEDHFDDAILSYANQRGVTLQGPEDIDELTANLSGEVDLPRKGVKRDEQKDKRGKGKDGKDPWGWNIKLKKYKSMYKKENNGNVGIGGDSLDITTWSSSQRKQASFARPRRDPLGKREIEAIKNGMVMQLG